MGFINGLYFALFELFAVEVLVGAIKSIESWRLSRNVLKGHAVRLSENKVPLVGDGINFERGYMPLTLMAIRTLMILSVFMGTFYIDGDIVKTTELMERDYATEIYNDDIAWNFTGTYRFARSYRQFKYCSRYDEEAKDLIYYSMRMNMVGVGKGMADLVGNSSRSASIQVDFSSIICEDGVRTQSKRETMRLVSCKAGLEECSKPEEERLYGTSLNVVSLGMQESSRVNKSSIFRAVAVGVDKLKTDTQRSELSKSLDCRTQKVNEEYVSEIGNGAPDGKYLCIFSERTLDSIGISLWRVSVTGGTVTLRKSFKKALLSGSDQHGRISVKNLLPILDYSYLPGPIELAGEYLARAGDYRNSTEYPRLEIITGEENVTRIRPASYIAMGASVILTLMCVLTIVVMRLGFPKKVPIRLNTYGGLLSLLEEEVNPRDRCNKGRKRVRVGLVETNEGTLHFSAVNEIQDTVKYDGRQIMVGGAFHACQEHL